MQFINSQILYYYASLQHIGYSKPYLNYTKGFAFFTFKQT